MCQSQNLFKYESAFIKILLDSGGDPIQNLLLNKSAVPFFISGNI